MLLFFIKLLSCIKPVQDRAQQPRRKDLMSLGEGIDRTGKKGLGALVMGLLYNDMRREEKNSLKRFGDDYRHYMENVPRINVVAGILRHVQRRNSQANA